MPELETLLAFAAATLIFAVMPGPALLFTAAQTLAHGKRGGMRAAFGIHCGGIVHVIAATLGLASLFSLAPFLYTAFKIGGAVYLIYLGTRILFKPKITGADAINPPPKNAAFFQSALVEVLNPKTALFFIAFLPQFVDPAASLPVWAQFLIFGTIVNLASSVADIVAIVLTGHAMSWAQNNGLAERVTRWIGGSVLIGLGAHLALSRD